MRYDYKRVGCYWGGRDSFWGARGGDSRDWFK